MSHDQTEFAEFFQASWEPCLLAVIARTGSVQLPEDQVAEAFARAWSSAAQVIDPNAVRRALGRRPERATGTRPLLG